MLVVSYYSTMFLFCVMLIAVGPQAQGQQRFDAALIAGFNASQIDGDNLAGYEKLGVHAGAKAYARFSENFSFGMELLFSQKGSKSGLNPTGTNVFKLLLNYAEIPLLFHYHDKDRAIFGIGASYAAFVSYKRIEQGVNTTNAEPPVFPRDWNILLDLAVLAFKQHFALNFRFAYSLTPIAIWPGSTIPGNKVFNNLLTVRLLWFPRVGQ